MGLFLCHLEPLVGGDFGVLAQVAQVGFEPLLVKDFALRVCVGELILADSRGEILNSFVNRAIDNQMERDNAAGKDADRSDTAPLSEIDLEVS
jgi:hypothetical protein